MSKSIYLWDKFSLGVGTLSVTAKLLGGGVAVYAANGFSPEFVADFASDEYFVDSASSTFGDTFTFSRTGTATYTDSTGTLQTAATGVARTGHHIWDGSSWVNGGLLLESEARTNLVVYSEDFTNASWTKINSTITANSGTSPTGKNDAALLSDAGTSAVQLNQAVSASAGANTASIYAKSGTVDFITIRSAAFDAGGNGYSSFDLALGSVFSSDAAHDAKIVDVGDGWYRCSITFSTSTDLNGNVNYYLNADGGNVFESDFVGDGTSSILIYGAQFEEGATASSYIPTAGSTVTRAAETLNVAAADMPSYTDAFSIAMEGAMNYVQSTSGADSPVVFWRWQANTQNRVVAFLVTDDIPDTTGEFRTYQEASDILDVVEEGAPGSYDPDTANAFNVSARYTSSEINAAVDGVALTANTTPTATPDLSAIDFEIGPDFMGTIKMLRVWGDDISDAGVEDASA